MLRQNMDYINLNNPETGICDTCHLRNIKVQPLNCKRHYYCNVCREFVLRFQRKDFSCRVCVDKSDHRRKSDEKLQAMDQLICNQTRMYGGDVQFKDIAISLDGAKVLTFEDTDDDENDLDSNAEWDHLLQASQEEQKKPKKKPEEQTKSRLKSSSDHRQDRRIPSGLKMNRRSGAIAAKPSTGVKPGSGVKSMARKMSFLKLVLPSANSETSGHVDKNDDPNLLLARSPASLDCRLPRNEHKTPGAMLREDGTNKGIHSSTPTSSPDSERETDSSPQKVIRQWRYPLGWLNDDSDTEPIEGPGFDGDSNSALDKLDKDTDDFYDY